MHVPKIGDIKIKLHRQIEGRIKRLTIRKAATGKWFACFSVEIEDLPKPPWKDGSIVGIDVGLASFATLSNGEKIPNPRFFRDEEKELARVQRKLSKAAKGTLDRKAALKVVERVHERIANKRYEFVHQVSRGLVNRFGLIAFEDLNIKNMLQNHCLAKSISILVEKTLADRVHNCSECGLSLDRDWNAAINILRLGLQSLPING